jgi:hypothetical protein
MVETKAKRIIIYTHVLMVRFVLVHVMLIGEMRMLLMTILYFWFLKEALIIITI